MLLAVRSIILSLLLTLCVVVPSSAAQSAAARSKLMVTVSDPSGAVIPDATVTIVGLDDALKSVTIAPAKTVASGTATFEGQQRFDVLRLRQPFDGSTSTGCSTTR